MGRYCKSYRATIANFRFRVAIIIIIIETMMMMMIVIIIHRLQEGLSGVFLNQKKCHLRHPPNSFVPI
jgi:hypothetical protein